MFLAHKQSRLLVVVALIGSVATIALSFLLVPPYASDGAAMALAGGALVHLVASFVASARLTHVRVPWREVALSVLVAVVCGGLAAAVDHVLMQEPAIVRLAVGGAAGGLASRLTPRCASSRPWTCSSRPHAAGRSPGLG